MSTTLERRFLPATELRVEGSAPGGPRIMGYAALFNSDSEDLGGFVERIAPGAFADALETSDIRALFNHDPNYVLGRKRAGSLTVREDEKGLWMEIAPPDAQWARDLMVSIGRGDISQMSFAFRLANGGDEWEQKAGAPMIRTIKRVKDIADVSPVTYPAYPDTSVAVRSKQIWVAEHRAADDGYSVGDRVRVRQGVEHDPMTADKVGVVSIVSTPALGIEFDGMDGVHKWYVAAEVVAEDAPADEPMKKMSAHVAPFHRLLRTHRQRSVEG